MKIGLIGRKRGMTRVFTEAGESVPVTVIEGDQQTLNDAGLLIPVHGTQLAEPHGQVTI